MICAAELGNDRGDRRILVAIAVEARRSVEVAGLKDSVRLVVAVACVDGANDREVIEKGRLLGQVLANPHAGEPSRNGRKRTAILRRPLGLWVPGIDVARSAGHPQQDHALAVLHGAATLDRVGAGPQYVRQRQPGESTQAGFEHAAAAGKHQTFASACVEGVKRMGVCVRQRAGPLAGTKRAGTAKKANPAGDAVLENNRFQTRAK